MNLPALSESRPLRLTTVTAMYVAQGIQIGLLIVAFPAYMDALDRARAGRARPRTRSR